MKESTLIDMKNKTDAVIRMMQRLMDEQAYMRDLSVGTFETIKLMPGYEEAIKTLTERAKEGTKNDDTEVGQQLD
jgi:hypothetical protein